MGAVQDEACRGDDAVAAFLLDAGQAGQKFVGHILAQACFAECTAGDGQDFGCAMGGLAIRFEAADAEARAGDIVYLAQIVR